MESVGGDGDCALFFLYLFVSHIIFFFNYFYYYDTSSISISRNLELQCNPTK